VKNSDSVNNSDSVKIDKNEVKIPTVRELYQAVADGKQIQFNSKLNKKWFDWNMNDSGYVLGTDLVNQWRIKEETETITATYPKPCYLSLRDGQVYWFVDPSCSNGVAECIWTEQPRVDWDDDDYQLIRLNNGVVHLTEEGAVLHAEALGWSNE
jgi:competence transcription factor ComK